MKLPHRSLAIVIFTSILLSACQLPGQQKKAGLQIVTGDTASSLFLNGQYLEKSPFVEKSLQPGEYSLRIEPDDQKLLPHDMSITLRPGLMTVVTWRPGERPELSAGVTYELEPIDGGSSELNFISIPDGAIVTVLGQPKAFAPTNLKLDPGEYEFEVSLPSYQSQKHSVKLVRGYRTRVSITLAKDSAIGTTTTTTNPSPNASVSASLGARLASASAQIDPTSIIASASAVTSGPRVKILSTGFRQNGIEGLRVRSSATPSSSELGFAPTGSVYSYDAKSENGWHAIVFNSQTGWVSGQFTQLIQE